MEDEGEEMFFYVWSNLFSLLCFFHVVSHEDIFFSWFFFVLNKLQMTKKSFLFLDFTHEKNISSEHVQNLFFFA